MELKKGDTVSVLDEALTGTVLKVKNNTVTIETDDGFPLDFSAGELVKIDGDTDLNQRVFVETSPGQVLSEKNQFKKRKPKPKLSKKKAIPAMEVDLHIHKLTDNTRGMDNYDMLTLQIDTAKRQLDFAIKKRRQRVVFIHGVGQGVLKAELETLFRRYDNLKHYDADYRQYGVGATEVYIYQNPKAP